MDKTNDKKAKGASSRVNINDPFARRLMVRYLGRREADLQSLRCALTKKDFNLIRTKGHNMFGSGSAYGIDQISELGASLETAAKKQNGEKIGQLIDSLEALIRSLRVV